MSAETLKPRRRTFAARASRSFWLMLIALAIYGWLLYLPFLEGILPGIYPITAIYSTALGAIEPFLLLGLVITLPMLAMIVVLALLIRRRLLWRVARLLLAIALLPIVLLPTLITCKPGQSLAVDKWGMTYHTAYKTFLFDDNYGDALLFQCDRTGVFCYQVHRFYGAYGVETALRLTYSADSNQLSMATAAGTVYIRSRQYAVCAFEQEPLGSYCNPQK